MDENNVERSGHEFLGKFSPWNFGSSDHVVDGRFLSLHHVHNIIIFDLFHHKTKEFCCDFSSASIDGSPVEVGESEIRNIFALSTDTILISFYNYSDGTDYLAVGLIDYERSLVVVKQMAKIPRQRWHLGNHWLPLSYPPNLYEGLIFKSYAYEPSFTYLMVKMNVDNQLQVSSLNVPSKLNVFGCFDGYLYALDFGQKSNTRRSGKPKKSGFGQTLAYL
ncbi:hypothetical protein M3Y94_00979900 [Aphelenchoides besseyi]|nr:hypothetical protein M3Y94_00979900 [Aphelenchoides besseyi]